MQTSRLTRTVGILAVAICAAVAFSGVAVAAGSTTLGGHSDGPPVAADGDLDPQNGTGWYEAQAGGSDSGLSAHFASQGEGEGSQSGIEVNNTAEGSMSLYFATGGDGWLILRVDGDRENQTLTVVAAGAGGGKLIGNSGGENGGVTCTFSPDQQGPPCE